MPRACRATRPTGLGRAVIGILGSSVAEAPRGRALAIIDWVRVAYAAVVLTGGQWRPGLARPRMAPANPAFGGPLAEGASWCRPSTSVCSTR